jgi:uncharacterized membrane protein HdeD (DUF308 family)
MAPLVGERWWERHAWWIFFLLGVLTVISAPIGLAGVPPNPPSPEATTGLSLDQMAQRIPGFHAYITSIARQLGNFMLASGVLMTLVAAFPYRKGERWAWFAAWTMPVLLAIQLANSHGGLGWQADAALIPITVAALLLSFRHFFGRPSLGH